MELLRDAIERLSVDMHRRMDDVRDLTTERHNQNLAVAKDQAMQLRALDTDVRSLTVQVTTTNGIVKAHTEDLQTLFGRPLPISLANLRWYLACFAAGVIVIVSSLSALVAVLHWLKVI